MKNKQNKNRTAFTLVELIVALCAAAVVLLAAAVILIAGQNFLNREWQQVNLERDAAYAIQVIKQSVRSAKKAQLEDDGALTIYNDAGTMKFWYDQEHKDILYRQNADDPQILLLGIAESASFAVDPASPNTVKIDISVNDGSYETQITSTTMMRNFGS